MLAAKAPSASHGGRREDDPELRVKPLDLRPHDRDVAAQLAVRIEQR